MRTTFSRMRPPNTPFWQTTTVSPGSTRLTKAASMPADPGAEIGTVNALRVCMANRSSSFSSSIMPTKRGSRWPMVGRAMASSTRRETGDGPGPSRRTSGGWKLAMVLSSIRNSR